MSVSGGGGGGKEVCGVCCLRGLLSRCLSHLQSSNAIVDAWCKMVLVSFHKLTNRSAKKAKEREREREERDSLK